MRSNFQLLPLACDRPHRARQKLIVAIWTETGVNVMLSAHIRALHAVLTHLLHKFTQDPPGIIAGSGLTQHGRIDINTQY